MYVCLCRGITESAVRSLGPQSRIQLIARLRLDEGGSCGRCIERIDELVTLTNTASQEPAFAACAVQRTIDSVPDPDRD